MGRMLPSWVFNVAIIRFYKAISMVVINAICVKWVQLVGGSDTIYTILSLMFVFTILFVFYKIST